MFSEIRLQFCIDTDHPICEARIGTGPLRARTLLIYVDLWCEVPPTRQDRRLDESCVGMSPPHLSKGVLIFVSLKSIYSQIRRLKFITRNIKEKVDRFVRIDLRGTNIKMPF